MKYDIASKEVADDFLSSEKRAYKKFVFKSNIVLLVSVFLVVGLFFSTRLSSKMSQLLFNIESVPHWFSGIVRIFSSNIQPLAFYLVIFFLIFVSVYGGFYHFPICKKFEIIIFGKEKAEARSKFDLWFVAVLAIILTPFILYYFGFFSGMQ